DVLAEVAAHKRSDECAEVDAHIEDREAGIAPRSTFGIEIAYDCADVRLEQTSADDYQHEPKVKAHNPPERHAEVSGSDYDSSNENRSSITENAISDPAARKHDKVDAGSVQPVDGRSRHGAQREPAFFDGCLQEQHQQRAHPVITEALPHLGEKQRCETSRMTADARRIRLNSCCLGCDYIRRHIDWSPLKMSFTNTKHPFAESALRSTTAITSAAPFRTSTEY